MTVPGFYFNKSRCLPHSAIGTHTPSSFLRNPGLQRHLLFGVHFGVQVTDFCLDAQVSGKHGIHCGIYSFIPQAKTNIE